MKTLKEIIFGKRSRKRTALEIALISIVVLGFLGLSDVIPPATLTENRFEFTERRIQEYAAQNHRLPMSLADLPIPQNYDARTTDGWGRPFSYMPQPDGSALLKGMGMPAKNDEWTLHFPIVDIKDKQGFLANFTILGDLWGVADEIRSYVIAHHRPPSRLSDIEAANVSGASGQPESWTGPIGPISYSLRPGGSVILSQYGKWGSDKVFSLEITIPEANLH